MKNSFDTLELIKIYKQGKKEVLNDLIEMNKSLMYSLINRYRYIRKEEREDLLQVASIGLIKSIENFDFNYDVSFSTYAVPIILGEIKKYFREASLVKVSRNLKDLYYKIEKEKKEYLNKYNKEITLDLLEEKLNIDRYELILALDSSNAPISIEKEYENDKDSGLSIKDMISDSKNNNLIDLITLNEAINDLTNKEKVILNLRYYKDLSQNEIASKFNISQVQVSRLEKSIINKLRKRFN